MPIDLIGLLGVADNAAIRPFDLAVSLRDFGLRQHHQPALEAAGACDAGQFLGRGLVQGVVDADHHVRGVGELLEAFGGERRDLGERLARDQVGCELAADRDGKLDGFGFQALLDRGKPAGELVEGVSDMFERDRLAARRDRGAFLFSGGKAVAEALALGFPELDGQLGRRERLLRRSWRLRRNRRRTDI